MDRHAVPYAAANCRCPVQPCGGIVPDPECRHHGAKKNPAMEWHEAGGPRCRQLAGGD